jgi:hypothetical protein
MKAHKHSHHRYAETIRHSLRDGFNGFLRALPGEPGFLATIACEIIASTSLISASGYQDHTTSPSTNGAFVCRTLRGHRIPKPNVRDDREASLKRAGMESLYCCFYPTEKRNIFCDRAGQGFADLPVGQVSDMQKSFAPVAKRIDEQYGADHGHMVQRRITQDRGVGRPACGAASG